MHLWKSFLFGIVCACAVCVVNARADGCQPGYYMDGTNGCVPCLTGHYCNGTDEPKPCEAAEIPSGDASNCEPCPDETPYANIDHTQCVTCDAIGWYVDNGVCMECAVGNYVMDGQCLPCPAGSYCPGDGMSHRCSGAYVTTTDGLDVCVPCSGDTQYANSNHTQCVACNGANEYPENGVCMNCGAGFYMNGNNCLICPAGSYCSGNGNAVKCAIGKYSAAGATQCNDCDTGYTTNETGATECDVCVAGYYKSDDACVVCDAGYYCTGGDNAPVACAKGYYSATTGAESCTRCPSGETTSGTGATACNACMGGYCNASSDGISCKQCKSGYYCPEETISCSNNGTPTSTDYKCAKGTYSGAGAASCTICPPGYTTNNTGATKIDDCKLAPVRLGFGYSNSVELPSCLTRGKINTSVVKNVADLTSDTNVNDNVSVNQIP